MCVFVVFFGAQCVQLPLPDDMVASTFAVLLLFDFNTEEFDYALNLEKKIIMKWALITKPAGKHAGWNGINPQFNLLSHFPNMSQEAELEIGSPTEPCYRHHIAPKHSGFVLKMFQHVWTLNTCTHTHTPGVRGKHCGVFKMDALVPADETIPLKHFSLKVPSTSCVLTQFRLQASVKITTRAFFS